MGLFFERRAPSPDVVNLMKTALQTPPPAQGTTQQQAMALAGDLDPLVQMLSETLDSQPPANPGVDAAVAAQATVGQLLGGPSFNTGRFLIAFLIFAVLVGGGIASEATHLTTSAGVLFGFAGAIFGIVTAFLGSEKGSS